MDNLPVKRIVKHNHLYNLDRRLETDFEIPKKYGKKIKPKPAGGEKKTEDGLSAGAKELEMTF